jgi:hypothetical protein
LWRRQWSCSSWLDRILLKWITRSRRIVPSFPVLRNVGPYFFFYSKQI